MVTSLYSILNMINYIRIRFVAIIQPKKVDFIEQNCVTTALSKGIIYDVFRRRTPGPPYFAGLADELPPPPNESLDPPVYWRC